MDKRGGGRDAKGRARAALVRFLPFLSPCQSLVPSLVHAAHEEKVRGTLAHHCRVLFFPFHRAQERAAPASSSSMPPAAQHPWPEGVFPGGPGMVCVPPPSFPASSRSIFAPPADQPVRASQGSFEITAVPLPPWDPFPGGMDRMEKAMRKLSRTSDRHGTTISDLQSRIDALPQRVAGAGDVEEMTAQMEDLRASLVSATEARTELEQDVARLQRAMEEDAERAAEVHEDRLQEVAGGLRKRVQELEEELRKKDSEVEKLKGKNDGLSDMVRKLKEDVGGWQQQVRGRDEKIAALERQLEREKKTVKELLEKLDRLEKRCATLVEQNCVLSDRVSCLEEELGDLRRVVSTMGSSARQLQGQIEDVQGREREMQLEQDRLVLGEYFPSTPHTYMHAHSLRFHT